MMPPALPCRVPWLSQDPLPAPLSTPRGRSSGVRTLRTRLLDRTLAITEELVWKLPCLSDPRKALASPAGAQGPRHLKLASRMPEEVWAPHTPSPVTEAFQAGVCKLRVESG